MTKNKNNKIVIPDETLSYVADREKTIPEKFEEKYKDSAILQQLIQSTEFIDAQINRAVTPIKENLTEVKNSNTSVLIEFSHINGKFTLLLWLLGIVLPILIWNIIDLNKYTHQTNDSIILPALKEIPSIKGSLTTISNDVNSLKEERKLNSYKINELENKTKFK